MARIRLSSFMMNSELIVSSNTFLGLKALSCSLRPPDTSHGFCRRPFGYGSLELDLRDVIYKKEYRKCALNERFQGLTLI